MIKSIFTFLRYEQSAYFLIAVFISILVSFSYAGGLFSGLENFFEDIFFSPKPISPDLVIVSIDNESIARLGQWPWPRDYFARALLNLNENPPKSVGFDILLSESSRLGTSDDAALRLAIAQVSYPIVFPVEGESFSADGEVLSAARVIQPLPSFIDSKNVSLGHINLILDSDNIVRKFPLTIEGRGGDKETYQAFSYEIFKTAGGDLSGNNSSENISRIAFSFPAGSVRRIPFWRLLEKGFGSELKNKIVLIGSTSPDLHDENLTPMGKGRAMPGVEIQANIVNMFLSGYRLESLSAGASLLWVWIAALLSALLFYFFKQSFVPVFLNIVLGGLYLVLILLLFSGGSAANFLHIQFSWILSTAGIFSYRYFAGEKEKSEIKTIFSKYVSADVLKSILRDPKKVALGGEEKEVTILFADIRGFTTLSEKTSPQELVRILNIYFTAMTDEILKQKGVLNKYIGDAIMAFWGAPLEESDQADKALSASLNMLARLKEVNEELRRAGDPEINIGIGLYTGRVVAGNIGSDSRFDYTVIGDAVNIASRLESLNKEYKTKIIIGESTKNMLKENFGLRFLDSVAIRGREEKVKMYTIFE